MVDEAELPLETTSMTYWTSPTSHFNGILPFNSSTTCFYSQIVMYKALLLQLLILTKRVFSFVVNFVTQIKNSTVYFDRLDCNADVRSKPKQTLVDEADVPIPTQKTLPDSE